MKRIVLILVLVFSGVWGEEDSQWKSYFGVEAGVGLMDIEPAFFASFNYGLSNLYILRGMSYGAGILGGWQKYTSEKVGMRNTLGLRVFGTKDTKARLDKYKESEGYFISDSTFYYALDGLFDFVKKWRKTFWNESRLLNRYTSPYIRGCRWLWIFISHCSKIRTLCTI